MIEQLLYRLAHWYLHRVQMRHMADMPEEMRLKFKKAEFDEHGFTAEGTSKVVTLFAAEAAEMLERSNAKNYVQVDMIARLDSGIRPIRLTAQWANGMQPAEKASRLNTWRLAALGRHPDLGELDATLGLGESLEPKERIE